MKEWILTTEDNGSLLSLDFTNLPELVRCKNCKFWIPTKIPQNKEWVSFGCCKNGHGEPVSNFYCADGIKKE